MFEQSVNFDYCSKESRVRLWLLQVLAEPTVASRKPKLAISKFDQLVQTYLYKRDRADKLWKLNKRAAGTLMETPHRTRPSVGMGTMSILFTATIEIEDFCFLTAIIGSIAKSRITHLHYDCNLVWCNRCCICADNV